MAGRLIGLLGVLVLAGQAWGQDYVVQAEAIEDRKPVFATVETEKVVRARTRIGGTLDDLTVEEGDQVEAGQVLARVVDEKLVLKRTALEASIDALEAQLAFARQELERARKLVERNVGSRSRLEEAISQVDTLEGRLAATRAEKATVQRQLEEGAVLAPAAGRVLDVPVVTGTVVMPGEPVATLAARNYVLRLRLPERHARFMAEGDSVRVGRRGLALDDQGLRTGRIVKVYPEIRGGEVIADVAVAGLGDFFVGERVRVHVATGERQTFMIPRDYVYRRHGLHYVRLADGREVVVQPGQTLGDRVEILSGLEAGDTLVPPGGGA